MTTKERIKSRKWEKCYLTPAGKVSPDSNGNTLIGYFLNSVDSLDGESRFRRSYSAQWMPLEQLIESNKERLRLIILIL